MFAQRQHGQGLAMAEPFPCDAMVRKLVLHPAYQHALAEIVLVGADAERATGFRETAVGGDQERRVQARSVLQIHFGLLRRGPDRFDPRVRIPVQRRQALDGPPGGGADAVVRHQAAQLRPADQRAFHGHPVRRFAFHDPRRAQRGDIVLRNVFPHAEFAQQADRSLGEGDLASVERRFGDGRFRLPFEQRHPQGLPGQGAGQAQSRRAGSDDDHVVAHADTSLRKATFRSVGIRRRA